MVSPILKPILRRGDEMITLPIKFVPFYVWMRYHKDWWQREPDTVLKRNLVRGFGRRLKWDIPNMDMLVTTFANQLPVSFINLNPSIIVDRFTL